MRFQQQRTKRCACSRKGFPVRRKSSVVWGDSMRKDILFRRSPETLTSGSARAPRMDDAPAAVSPHAQPGRSNCPSHARYGGKQMQAEDDPVNRPRGLPPGCGGAVDVIGFVSFLLTQDQRQHRRAFHHRTTPFWRLRYPHAPRHDRQSGPEYSIRMRQVLQTRTMCLDHAPLRRPLIQFATISTRE